MSDIRAWLEEHDLGRYADSFEENEITLDLARDLSDCVLYFADLVARLVSLYRPSV